MQKFGFEVKLTIGYRLQNRGLKSAECSGKLWGDMGEFGDWSIKYFLAGRGAVATTRRGFIGGVILGAGAAAVAMGFVGKEVLEQSRKPTDEQRKARWLLGQNHPDLITNLTVIGGRDRDRVIPARLRNRPATETSDPQDSVRPGKIIDELAPGTNITKALPVWGENTHLGGRGRIRWLAVELASGQVGFVHPDLLEPNANIYRTNPIDLATVPLPSAKSANIK